MKNKDIALAHIETINTINANALTSGAEALRTRKHANIMACIRILHYEDSLRIEAMARKESANKGTRAVGTTGCLNLDIDTMKLAGKAYRVYKATCENAGNGLKDVANVINNCTREELLKCWDGAGMKPAAIIRLVAKKQTKK